MASAATGITSSASWPTLLGHALQSRKINSNDSECFQFAKPCALSLQEYFSDLERAFESESMARRAAAWGFAYFYALEISPFALPIDPKSIHLIGAAAVRVAAIFHPEKETSFGRWATLCRIDHTALFKAQVEFIDRLDQLLGVDRDVVYETWKKARSTYPSWGACYAALLKEELEPVGAQPCMPYHHSKTSSHTLSEALARCEKLFHDEQQAMLRVVVSLTYVRRLKQAPHPLRVNEVTIHAIAMASLRLGDLMTANELPADTWAQVGGMLPTHFHSCVRDLTSRIDDLIMTKVAGEELMAIFGNFRVLPWDCDPIASALALQVEIRVVHGEPFSSRFDASKPREVPMDMTLDRMFQTDLLEDSALVAAQALQYIDYANFMGKFVLTPANHFNVMITAMRVADRVHSDSVCKGDDWEFVTGINGKAMSGFLNDFYTFINFNTAPPQTELEPYYHALSVAFPQLDPAPGWEDPMPLPKHMLKPVDLSRCKRKLRGGEGERKEQKSPPAT
jgi:hypothetical protein